MRNLIGSLMILSTIFLMYCGSGSEIHDEKDGLVDYMVTLQYEGGYDRHVPFTVDSIENSVHANRVCRYLLLTTKADGVVIYSENGDIWGETSPALDNH